MPTRALNTFTTIRTEGALLPPDLLQRIADGKTDLEGLTPSDYHHPGEKINEAINRSWNALQGAWANFKAARDKLPPSDLGTSLTRERWLLPLFRELEYGRLPTAQVAQIDGKTYPISHHWEQQIPIHLVSFRLKLDERVPGVTGAASASPHSLVQVFLNRSEEHLWGFVSNGRQLRILRDKASLTRQAFVEFDLEGMMDSEVYADFVLLWLLCHQSRIENGHNCWLEQWMKTAEQQGTRALDQLRDGVQQAIEALGVGFLEHPGNTALRDRLQSGTLNAQDYYRQLLRIVYRLLFLFVAEDRGLLYDPDASEDTWDCYQQFYSTQRLRRIAERLKGTRHTDLFESLRLVMKLLSGDNNGAGAQLGLPVLGSFLFSDDAVADVIGCQIANVHLLDAVWALAFKEDNAIRALRPVDYKNLGSEELGSVYESLLELHPQINTPARTFALATAGGNERKTTGSYYTPSSLIYALLDSALNPVIDEALKKPDSEATLLNLKICDPACGSGHFLIAAAHRIAKALATVRTGEEEPAPDTIRHALRDVIGSCIYGVDINPDAVELCKVALWLEALEPGKPLSFLDHRIQCGNSLIGTTPRLIAEGIPEGAFQPIEGDDKKFTANLRKQNEQERKQNYLFNVSLDTSAEQGLLGQNVESLDAIPDDSITGIRQKAEYYRQLAASPEYRQTRLLADAWCAAFVWRKVPGTYPVTNFTLRQLRADPASVSPSTIPEIVRLADVYQFFHWHVAFPNVFELPDNPNDAENPQSGWNGGFDCVLGNPPWEHTEIEEKEWFAERRPEIANADTGAKRKRLIQALEHDDPSLYGAFIDAYRQSAGISHFMRNTGRYPFCARGRINTYAVFAEMNRHLISSLGYLGCIVPSGIAIDDSTKFFFWDLMVTKALVKLYSFENEGLIFPAIHHFLKFCLLTISGVQKTNPITEFLFFAREIEDLDDLEKHFILTADDIMLINPNTRTCATFRRKYDAELAKRIYGRVPVLIREQEPEVNPWKVSFKQGLFNMTSDSHLFHTREQLEAENWQLMGNLFTRGEGVCLPLYEGRMIHHFNHRVASLGVDAEKTFRSGVTIETPPTDYSNPNFVVLPRYWVHAEDVQREKPIGYRYRWYVGFRDVSSAVSERTMVCTIIPDLPVGNKLPLLLTGERSENVCGLIANLSSYAYDYSARQKMGGLSLNFFIVKQLPVLSPETYTSDLLTFIVPRVLELTYTSWDLNAFAEDCHYDGSPFRWDEERRLIARCELDALFFHLYVLADADVDYIMDTFWGSPAFCVKPGLSSRGATS